MTVSFGNRDEAGRRLAELFAGHQGQTVVLGLARGGVPVGRPIAQAIGCPLDALIVRKLGVPRQPELGFGAITEGGHRVLNASLIEQAGLTEETIEAVAQAESVEVARRVEQYRGGRPMQSVAAKVVVVVDDGIATGSTAAAAIELLRSMGPARIILAVPVAAPDTVAWLETVAD
ncbi:MAG: phosphoribosyltransferase [Acidimicrobiales bacterium]